MLCEIESLIKTDLDFLTYKPRFSSSILLEAIIKSYRLIRVIFKIFSNVTNFLDGELVNPQQDADYITKRPLISALNVFPNHLSVFTKNEN